MPCGSSTRCWPPATARSRTLVPAATRQALSDPVGRATLQVFADANLNVAATAAALSLHPNSLCYRLGRIAELAGRDPRQLADLLELIAASRVLTGPAGQGA
jgi:DNA-binding PucR family transcriptional regulator